VSGTGNNYALRLNAEQLEYNIKTEKSQELRADARRRRPHRRRCRGGRPDPDRVLVRRVRLADRRGLCTAPSNVVGTNGAATGTATFSSTGIQFSAGTPFAAVESGQYIRVTGAVNTGNNGIFGPATGILSTGTGIGFGTGTFTAETGTANVVVYGARFKNGTTKISHSIERLNNDLTGARYECFRGQVVDKWSLTGSRPRVIGRVRLHGQGRAADVDGSGAAGHPHGEPHQPDRELR
jgi:hypothetical protein